MSSQSRVAPTRRTVLRSAAWSTAAVTVVVATPNVAAASPGTPLKLSMSGSSNTRRDIGNSGKDDLVWTFTIRNDGSSPIAAGTLRGVFNAPSATSVTSVTSASGTWTSGIYTGGIPVSGSIKVTVTFRRDITGPGGSASANFTATGFTGAVPLSHNIT